MDEKDAGKLTGRFASAKHSKQPAYQLKPVQFAVRADFTLDKVRIIAFLANFIRNLYAQAGGTGTTSLA